MRRSIIKIYWWWLADYFFYIYIYRGWCTGENQGIEEKKVNGSLNKDINFVAGVAG